MSPSRTAALPGSGPLTIQPRSLNRDSLAG